MPLTPLGYWDQKVLHSISLLSDSTKLVIVMFVCLFVCLFVLVAVGEPPIALSSSVLFAVKRAVESARADAGNTEYFSLCKTFNY